MHGHNYDYARRLCRKVVNDMHFIFSYGFGVINLPREAVLRALPTLGGDCAKVLLALAANADLRIDTETKYEAIAAAAGVSLATAQDAVGSLAEQGLLVPAVLQQPEKKLRSSLWFLRRASLPRKKRRNRCRAARAKIAFPPTPMRKLRTS